MSGINIGWDSEESGNRFIDRDTQVIVIWRGEQVDLAVRLLGESGGWMESKAENQSSWGGFVYYSVN